jgi:hypothetical protein
MTAVREPLAIRNLVEPEPGVAQVRFFLVLLLLFVFAGMDRVFAVGFARRNRTAVECREPPFGVDFLPFGADVNRWDSMR